MRRFLPVLLASASLLIGSSAWADTFISDPLHGQCGGCSDNGTITPATSGALASGFGWSFSGTPGDNTGSLTMVFLAPQGDGFNGGTITGTNLPLGGSLLNMVGTWTLASQTDLSVFLGFTQGQPDNPFGAFAVGQDAGVTAFNVWTLNIPGILTLAQQGSPLSDTFFDANGVLSGLSIVAFLTGTPDGTIATAPSAQLQVSQLSTVPLPGAVFMFGPVLLGAWYWLRRRAKSVAARFAVPSGLATA